MDPKENSAQIVFSRPGHKVIAFTDLVAGEGVQSNQFLIVSGQDSILLDPGGDLTYIPLTMAMSRYLPGKSLGMIFASHQDPDIISALGRWMMNTPATVVTSRLWSRFLPHLVSQYVGKQVGKISQRMISVPDHGGRLPFGEGELLVLPAHFMHSVGNLQIYDPQSKTLFSGDLGASMVEAPPGQTMDFADMKSHMQGFHRRYIGSRRILELWVNMVQVLDIETIMPQHGPAIRGADNIQAFFDWLRQEPCGIDLMGQEHYQVPQEKLSVPTTQA